MSNKVFKRVAATLLAVLLLFYVGLQIYNSNHSSIQTETATYMTASDTIETTGYIVRNETYLTSDAGGVLNYVLEDGESVKENGVVAQIYASAEECFRPEPDQQASGRNRQFRAAHHSGGSNQPFHQP